MDRWNRLQRDRVPKEVKTAPAVPCGGCGAWLAGVPLAFARPMPCGLWVHYGGRWGRACIDRAAPKVARVINRRLH